MTIHDKKSCVKKGDKVLVDRKDDIIKAEAALAEASAALAEAVKQEKDEEKKHADAEAGFITLFISGTGHMSKCRIQVAVVAQYGLFRVLLGSTNIKSKTPETESEVNAEFIIRMNTDPELRKQFNICTMHKYDTENPVYIKAREQLLSMVANMYINTVGTLEGPTAFNNAVFNAEYIVRMNTDIELRKQFNICTMYEHDTENPIYIKAREQILNIGEDISKNIYDNIGQVSVNVVDRVNKYTVDTGPGGSSKGPCSIPGIIGCASAAASVEYGEPWYPTGSSDGIAPWPTTLASQSIWRAKIVIF